VPCAVLSKAFHSTTIDSAAFASCLQDPTLFSADGGASLAKQSPFSYIDVVLFNGFGFSASGEVRKGWLCQFFFLSLSYSLIFLAQFTKLKVIQ